MTGVACRPLVLHKTSSCVSRRKAVPERLYTFEAWGQQLLDFIDEVVGEPTLLVSNSVGGVLLDP